MTDHIDTARALIEPLTGYTPGPWEAAIYEDVGFINVPPGVGFEQGDFKPGDARLITAAPALRDMVATLADALEAEREENERLRTSLVRMVEELACDDPECDICAPARAALNPEGGE